MQAPGGLYLEGRFNGGFFCLTALGGLHLEGLIHGGAYFRNFTVCTTLMGFPDIASDGSPLFVEPMFLFG